MMQYAGTGLCWIAQKVSDVLIGVLFFVDSAISDLGGED